MVQLTEHFRRDEQGAAMVEYGLLVGLLAVVCFGATTLLGQELSATFVHLSADLAVV